MCQILLRRDILCIFFIPIGCNAYLLVLWKRHKSMGSMMQALHLVWSVGNAMSPFITSLFLTAPWLDSSRPTALNYTYNDSTMSMAEVMLNGSRWINNTDSGYGNVKLSYMCIGAFPLLNSFTFAVLFMCYGGTCSKTEKLVVPGKHSKSSHSDNGQVGCCFTAGLLALMFSFSLPFATIELIPGNLQ